MNPTRIAFSIFITFTLVSISAVAKDGAVNAAAVFKDATAYVQELDVKNDTELKAAVKTLKSWLQEGQRQLLNQKVDDALRTAERVSVQLELIKIWVDISLRRTELEQLQTLTKEAEERKIMLEAQYQRLLLSAHGRALTGAYPAPTETREGVKSE